MIKKILAICIVVAIAFMAFAKGDPGDLSKFGCGQLFDAVFMKAAHVMNSVNNIFLPFTVDMTLHGPITLNFSRGGIQSARDYSLDEVVDHIDGNCPDYKVTYFGDGVEVARKGHETQPEYASAFLVPSFLGKFVMHPWMLLLLVAAVILWFAGKSSGGGFKNFEAA